jgi:hypothetical protein
MSSTTTSSVAPTKVPTAQETSTNLAQTHLIETSDSPFTNKTRLDRETTSIDIDNETIKFILVGES